MRIGDNDDFYLPKVVSRVFMSLSSITGQKIFALIAATNYPSIFHVANINEA